MSLWSCVPGWGDAFRACSVWDIDGPSQKRQERAATDLVCQLLRGMQHAPIWRAPELDSRAFRRDLMTCQGRTGCEPSTSDPCRFCCASCATGDDERQRAAQACARLCICKHGKQRDTSRPEDVEFCHPTLFTSPLTSAIRIRTPSCSTNVQG